MAASAQGGIKTGSSTDLEVQSALQHAADAIDEVIRRVPLESDAYQYLASLYNFAGSIYGAEYYDRADSVSQDAIAMFPNDAPVRVEAAIALWSLGKEAEALAQLDAAGRLDGRYTTPLMVAADFFVQKEQWAKAQAAYQKVLAIEPGNAVARQALAYVESQLNQ
jgi:tetratricopeptide (TPR) repeat protein